MKKLKKITLNELKNEVVVLDKNEEKQCIGGLGTYNSDICQTVYTSADAALLKSFGLWDGGYVAGQGYLSEDAVSANAGMGSAYESYLTQMMSNSIPTVSGINMGASTTDAKFGMTGASTSHKEAVYNWVLNGVVVNSDGTITIVTQH